MNSKTLTFKNTLYNVIDSGDIGNGWKYVEVINKKQEFSLPRCLYYKGKSMKNLLSYTDYVNHLDVGKDFINDFVKDIFRECYPGSKNPICKVKESLMIGGSKISDNEEEKEPENKEEKENKEEPENNESEKVEEQQEKVDDEDSQIKENIKEILKKISMNTRFDIDTNQISSEPSGIYIMTEDAENIDQKSILFYSKDDDLSNISYDNPDIEIKFNNNYYKLINKEGINNSKLINIMIARDIIQTKERFEEFNNNNKITSEFYNFIINKEKELGTKNTIFRNDYTEVVNNPIEERNKEEDNEQEPNKEDNEQERNKEEDNEQERNKEGNEQEGNESED